MRLLERLFGPRRAQASPSEMGRGLAEIGSGSARPDLLEFLVEDLPNRSIADAFLAMAPLTLLAWIRASQSEPLALGSVTARKQIYDNLASFLVLHYVQLFGGDGEPDAIVYRITRKAHDLLRIWSGSQDRAPSPHWYVAKEVWFDLQGDRENPDPARIKTLSEILTTNTVTLLEFARQVQVSE